MGEMNQVVDSMDGTSGIPNFWSRNFGAANGSGRSGTLSPFELKIKWQDFRDKPLEEMLTALRAELKAYRNERSRYFSDLRHSESPWANGARKLLALLGTAAVLLAAIASAANLYSPATGTSTQPSWLAEYQIALWAAGASLLAYALIGAISFYEKATDTTSAYFRHLATSALIRDLWTKLEFSILKIVLETPKAEADSSVEPRKKVQALAEEFITNLNKVSSEELSVWHTDFVASLVEIDEAAKTGREAAEKSLKAAVAEAQAATDRALQAANAAEQASKPAVANFTIEGAFDGDVTILVDGQLVVRTHLKAYPVDQLRPGQRKVEASAKKGEAVLGYAKMVELKAGIQDVKIVLA